MASEAPGAEVSGEAWPDPGFGRSRAVLYIEDNLANLQLIQGILAYRPSIKLISAMKGHLGVDLAIRYHPDLILLDLHLPDIPGEEVFARLKAEATTNEIPIVVVSADASPETLRRLEALGVSRFLTKPVNVQLFLQTVDELLAQPDEAG
jgi:CheY-like chemotaxis protein